MRRRLSSKSDTCTEGMYVNAAGIPVELAMSHNMEHGFGYRLRRPEQKRAAQAVAHFFQRRLK